jgi:hypothetical protein
MFQDKNRRFTPSRLKKQWQSPKKEIKDRVIRDAEFYLSADEFDNFLQYVVEQLSKEKINYVNYDYLMSATENAPKLAYTLYEGVFYGGIFVDEGYVFDEFKTKKECFEWLQSNCK